jgi:hypothetical protein
MGSRPNPRESSGDIEAGGAHHFGGGGGVGPVGSRPVGEQLPGRGGEADQHGLRGLDGDQSRRESGRGERERQAPRCIDGDHLGAGGRAFKRADQVGKAHRLERNVALAIELGVDRGKVIVAVEGKPVTRHIDEKHRVRAAGLGPLQELAEGQDEVDLVEVRPLDDLEPNRTQRLGHEPRVVEGGWKRRLPVFGVADDEADPRRLLRAGRRGLHPH